MLGGKLFICSLTSWRARIKIVENTIRSLLNQTFKPDKIVLNLSREEFPQMDRELPPSLLDLAIHSPLEIYWVNGNSKAFKKLIPTLDRYRDAIVMTNDDDIIYPRDFLEEVTSHYTFEQPLTLNGGKEWGSGYGSIYEYRFFGKYLHAFDRKEVWATNEDDIAYGVLMMLNGYRYTAYGYEFWKKIHQVDEAHGLCANGQYNSSKNYWWFERYIARRYGVGYQWLKDTIKRKIKFDLNDSEPISNDTILQVHIDRGVEQQQDFNFVPDIPEQPAPVIEDRNCRLIVEKPLQNKVEIIIPQQEPEPVIVEKVETPRDIKKRKFLGEVKHIAETGRNKTFKKFINRH